MCFKVLIQKNILSKFLKLMCHKTIILKSRIIVIFLRKFINFPNKFNHNKRFNKKFNYQLRIFNIAQIDIYNFLEANIKKNNNLIYKIIKKKNINAT